MKKNLHFSMCAIAACLYFFSLSGTAEPAAYNALNEFSAALPNAPKVLNFDGLAAGTTIEDASSAEGIRFEYDFGGFPMKIAQLYATTSAPNFLGTSDGGMFHDGDHFRLSFPPGNAIGLFFISADPLIDGDITITAGSATASLSAQDVHATLADGSRVYFLGIVDTRNALTSVSVEALEGGFFLYNVDDIITSPIRETVTADLEIEYATQMASD